MAKIPAMNIKKILKIWDNKIASYLIVDQSAHDEIYKGCNRQFIMHPQKDGSMPWTLYPYKLQNYLGVPANELFVENKKVKVIFSNDAVFRDILKFLNKEVFDLQFRNGRCDIWLDK